MSRPRQPKRSLTAVLSLAGLLLVGRTAFAGDPGTPIAVAPARGWSFRVLHEGLAGVDNIVVGGDGAIYASRQLGQDEGEVVRITKGRVETLLSGVNRPHGMYLHGRFLYVTEEMMEGRVIEINLRTGSHRELATLHNPVGIAMMPGGDLAVTEDSVNGRILRLRKDGTTEVITAGLNRPQGLAVGRDGTLYACEAATGRVIEFRHGDMNVLVEDLDEPDQIQLADDGVLWITEDARPGRLLRYEDGNVAAVLSDLWTPQGMAVTGPATLLVAEQGRGRILLVSGTEQ